MKDEEQLQDLFAAAADMPTMDRKRFLNSECGDNANLRDDLERLIAADRKNGEGIIAAVEAAAGSVLGTAGMVGSRIGNYQVIGEIGSGGMGAVYLAVRADDQYQKRVAIKLIRRGMDTDDMLDRFRRERQILANLEHPHIARLLDGGAAADGRPFLVMEYVEGETLDAHCRTCDMGVRERCLLFLKVCAAVSYAHRNLVVHRDLKPGNILVAADGSPKLLDFGVAKLLEADAGSGRTVAQERPLTPDYASPEMIRAEPITTAADVYSLGAILYELLSGRRAHRFTSYSLREIERVVCESDPPLLSAAATRWKKQLEGDLEAIVSKAMRKEVASRYATVEELAADVDRHLNGWPVTARQGNSTYRARKFVRRNRMSIGAAALFAGALIGGATASAVQARRASQQQELAELERRHALVSQEDAKREAREAGLQRSYAEVLRQQAEQQRVLAETQTQIAERRFQQVRQLARKFLVDFHDAIAKLPGSTPARKMIVATGLEYYDTLVAEAKGNRELQEEIAQGYDRLGDVQGNPYNPNLGDIDGALASYRKAYALREKMPNPSAELVAARIKGNVRIAQLLTVKGDIPAAAGTFAEAFSLGEKGPAAQNYDVRDALGSAYSAYGDLWNRTAEYSRSIESYTRLLQIQVELARQHRNPPAEQSGISLGHTKLGDTYARMGRSAEALEHLRAALVIDRQLSTADPDNVPLLRKVLVDYNFMGLVFRTATGERLAPQEEQRADMEAAVAIGEKLAAGDPANVTRLMDVGMVHGGLADWLRTHKELDAAIGHYTKSLDAVRKLAAIGPVTLSNLDAVVQAHQRYGLALTDARRLDEAMVEFRQAGEALAQADKLSPGLTRLAKRHAEVHASLGALYALQNRWMDAVAEYRAGVAIAEDLWKRDPKGEEHLNAQPEAYEKIAAGYAAAGQYAGAIQAVETALDRWRQIAQRRPLAAAEEEERKDSEAKLALWQRR